MDYTAEQLGYKTEQLARQAHNFRALLDMFAITEDKVASALFTSQQRISSYVVGQQAISEKTETDIICFVADEYDVNINPGFLRGVDDRMTLTVEDTIDNGLKYWDADDAAEKLLCAAGFTFQYDQTHKVYDMKQNGRTVCEISRDDKEKLVASVLVYAAEQSRKLIKRKHPK